MNLIHNLSPFLYVGFVYLLQKIEPCPENYYMKQTRYFYNIFMSCASSFMLGMIFVGNFQTGKFYPLLNLFCKSYENNLFAYKGAELFLWSKYIEWFDTLFLHLSGKKISMLQYTHHMTTAFLMHQNLKEYLSPHIFIFMGLNCFIHIFMYLYFAEPKGYLYKYRELITVGQIIQHIICLLTIFITYKLGSENCEQNKYGNLFGLLLYLMYLFYFSIFYIKTYSKKYIKYFEEYEIKNRNKKNNVIILKNE